MKSATETEIIQPETEKPVPETPETQNEQPVETVGVETEQDETHHLISSVADLEALGIAARKTEEPEPLDNEERATRSVATGLALLKDAMDRGEGDDLVLPYAEQLAYSWPVKEYGGDDICCFTSVLAGRCFAAGYLAHKAETRVADYLALVTGNGKQVAT